MFSLLLLIFLILFSAIMSASETAFFSLSYFSQKSYSQSENNRKKLIARLLKHPRELLVTMMMLNITANIFIQNTVANIFDNYTTWFLKVGLPLAIVLLFGDIIPKSIAISNNKYITYKTAPFISIIAKIISPLRKVITKITGYISRILFFFLKKEKPISIDELYHVIDVSKKKNILNIDETKLAEGYLDLKDYSVKEIMKTKDQIVFYDINNPINDLEEIFNEKNFSNIPICNGSLDNIIGIMTLEDFFINKNRKDLKEQLKNIISKPFYIPETTKGWELLTKLKIKHKKLSIVVDEYGSVVGIISQKDLMEMIIGDIKEQEKTSELPYSKLKENVLIVDGKFEILDLNELFDIDLESSTSMVTVGGYLTEKMERIPSAGDKYLEKNLLFYVLDADEQKVKKIYIRKN